MIIVCVVVHLMRTLWIISLYIVKIYFLRGWHPWDREREDTPLSRTEKLVGSFLKLINVNIYIYTKLCVIVSHQHNFYIYGNYLEVSFFKYWIQNSGQPKKHPSPHLFLADRDTKLIFFSFIPLQFIFYWSWKTPWISW